MQVAIYAERLTAVFCFYQRGFSFILLEHHLQDWKQFAHLGSTSKFMLWRIVSQPTNQNCWITFPINLMVWVEELVTAKLHQAKAFTISALNYLAYTNWKLAIATISCLLSSNNLNAVIALTQAIFSDCESHITCSDFNKLCLRSSTHLNTLKSSTNCHIDICFKTKTIVAHAAKCWIQCHIYFKHSTHLYIVLPVIVANTYKSNSPLLCRWCR